MFKVLPFITPTWYYHLKPDSNIPYFPDFDGLDENSRLLLDFDHGYSNRQVSKLDAAWQAWNKGFILEDKNLRFNEEKLNIAARDEYRFVRKYFHPLWSWYVLLVRIFSGYNIPNELAAFWSQRKVHRVNLYERIFPHEPAFQQFESKLLQEAPLVSVIIPTLNRYQYLADALHDLEKQDYPNFNVIVVDQSEPFQPEFYDSFKLNIKVIRQEEKALWLARNTAIKASDAEWIALSEDDVRIPAGWLSNHIKCLDYFRADISAGIFFPAESTIMTGRNFFRWADQFATGNACLRREVFRQIGLFDCQFERQRMGDGEFGLRAYLAGFKAISNPNAWCKDVKAPIGGLRQMGSWDGFRPKSWLAPRPVPSVLYLCRKYFGNRAAFYLLLNGVPPSLIPYRFKRHSILLLLGLPLTILFLPLVAWQVMQAWQKSSQMLHEGAKIEQLEQSEHSITK